MDTIWFGNIYEYRSAYFHDVMYSNNQPAKEGALLFKDRVQATSLALLYQRYRKFDKDCYSIENATFFNIFGTETVRIGRYKVPQTDEIILCTTDPLTYTDMMRYFRSFAPMKYFRSQFMQQKRKRQYILNTRNYDGTNSKDDPLRDPEIFFRRAVHFIENGLFHEHKAKVDMKGPLKLPVQPLCTELQDTMLSSISTPDSIDQLRISLPLYKANSQYFLELLFQGILNNLNKSQMLHESTLMIGGDGRMLNNFAVETFLAIAAGNGVKEVKIMADNILSYPVARLAAEEGNDLTIVLSDPINVAGLNGYFGLQLLDSLGKTYSTSAYSDLVEDMAEVVEVSKMVVSGMYHNTKVTYHDKTCLSNYFLDLKKHYHLDEIKRKLLRSNLIISFDCAHGSVKPTISMLLEELNLLDEDVTTESDDSSIALLLNDQLRSDYYGKIPGLPVDSLDLFNRLDLTNIIDLSKLKNDILESLKNCKTSAECFQYAPPSSISKSEFAVNGAGDTGCPDFGFIYTSDGSSCDMITAAHGIVSADELRTITSTDAASNDALVLTINVLKEVLCEQETNLDLLIQKYREQNGKSRSLQLLLSDVPQDFWDKCVLAMKSTNLKVESKPTQSYFPSYKTKMKVYNDEYEVDDPDESIEKERDNKAKGLIEISNDVTTDFDVDSQIYSLKFPTQNAILRMYNTNHRDYDQMCDICMELKRIEYGSNGDLTSLFTPLAAIAVGSMISNDCQDDNDIISIIDRISITKKNGIAMPSLL